MSRTLLEAEPGEVRSHKAATCTRGLHGPGAEHYLPIFLLRCQCKQARPWKKKRIKITTPCQSVGRSVNVPRCVSFFFVWFLFLARPITPLRNSAPLALNAARSRLRHSIRSYFFSPCISVFSFFSFYGTCKHAAPGGSIAKK
jgi:hypothetical protein